MLFLRSLVFAPLSVLVTLISFNVYAAQGASSDKDLSLAKRAVAAIHATDQFDNFLPGAASELKSQLVSKDPNSASLISKIVDKQAMALVSRRADLEESAAKIYMKNFTTEELQAIIDFYTGPVGKKLLSTGPETIAELMATFKSWSMDLVRDLAANVNKELEAKETSSKSHK
ncbi:DUF2059 domain-containing protein [Bartonella sp. TP]|uniref:DUF2059 domain-containing protein n=1 Tax=Bartonella sp. TP TaxID=3057550 RepID=UPI0025AF1A37|nr:DUF2059 domain-containing protein [Bartonella sp. TP]MDN5248739.1 DUF2059 domain-containing protein [Alphaproteobacteria bacterium]WJW79886.1 DUF2059 domain-containing protein [Bartonella sp. TP]